MSVPGQQEVQHVGLVTEQLRVAQALTSKSSAQESAAEARDFAQAALFVCQAIVTMDPTRLQGGDTPEARKASTPTPPTRDTDRDGKVGER